MKPIIFNGVRYYKSKKSGYWKHNGQHEAPLTLHQAMWIEKHGPVPEGMEIHHIDEDKDHNEDSNFQLLTHHAHRVLHMRRLKVQVFVCRNCEVPVKYETRTNKRMIFCSQACNFNAWIKAHPIAPAYTEVFQRTCPHCTTTYETKYPTKVYCSLRCHRNAAKKRSRSK